MGENFPGRTKAEHGTNAGFQQHKIKGVPMCEACQKARKTYLDRYYRANKWKKAK